MSSGTRGALVVTGGGGGGGGAAAAGCGWGRLALARAWGRTFAEMLHRLVVDDGVRGLDRRRWKARRCGHSEFGQLALAEDGGGVAELRRVPQDPRAVEDEPGNGEPDEEGDVERLAEAAAGALVLDGVEEADEFVGVPFAMASGEDAERLLLRWRRLD